MYYDYPPPTYLEYPILIAQGEFQNQTTVRPDVIEVEESIHGVAVSSGLGAQGPEGL